MTPEQALRLRRQLQDDALAAEAAQLATGWRFLTIEGITIECDADLELYEQVLTAFREAADGVENRRVSASSRLTLGVRGAGAEQRIADLRTRLEPLNPPEPWSGRRWQVRDGAR